MVIQPYEPDLLPALTDAWNRAMSPVPHCYPVKQEEMSAVLVHTLGEGTPHERLHSEAAFVAMEGNGIVGFAHTAIGPLDHAPERGSIRTLWYERGHREAGQALLNAAEADLRAKGQNRIEAFHCDDGYRFYHVKYGYLSDELEHVQSLLKFNGYAVNNGEVILDWPNFEPVDPRKPKIEVGTERHWTEGRGSLPALEIMAVVNGERIGNCTCISCGEFTDAEDAQDWLFVDGLFIDDEYQGAGVGRYLLQLTMRELHRVGYRNATITTEWINHRALLFYSNYGFKKVDWTFGYERTLPTADP